MAYGILKVDTIIFDQGGADQNVTVSGIYRAITSGVTVTGTISGAVLIGTTTVSGATVTGTTVQGISGTFTTLTGTTTTGTTANFASGVFTTRVSGTTITGTTAQFTSGTFVSLTGTTITGTTISGTTVSSTTGTFTSLTGTTITGTTVNGTTVNSITGNFTTLTGITVTGTTVNFTSGVFTTQVSGLTVTGTQSSFTSGNFVTLSGATATFTSGVIASGTAAAPSLSIISDPNTGLYSPGADQVALATAGTGRLFVDASGRVGIGTASPSAALDVQGGGVKILTQGGTSFLEIGIGTATNQAAYIDLTTDTTYTDYGLRLIRDAAGANAVSQLTQRGTGDLSLRTEHAAPLTFYTTSTERFRIDSDGRLLVGTSSSRSSRLTTNSFNALLQIESNTEAAQAITRWAADGSGSRFHLQKGRGTIAAPTTVANGDSLGEFSFSGYDGANMTNGARIECFVDGTPGANDMPGRLVFQTTADGFASPTERMRISSAGTTTITSAASTAPFIANIGASEAARIDSSGRLLLGTSSTLGGNNSLLQIAGATSTAALQITRFNTADGCLVDLSSNRNAAIGSYTTAVNGDELARLRFLAYDGATQIVAAQITANVDGTPGTNDMPGRLVFGTTADGAASPTERMRITSSGNIITTGTFVDPAITGTILEDIYTITDGAAFEVDPGNGSIQLITLGASRTPKATNFTAGESVTLMVKCNIDPAYTITWTDATWGTGGVIWKGGSAPTLASTGYSVIQFWKVGTQVYGASVGDVA